jgi:site-specific recombinase XerD
LDHFSAAGWYVPGRNQHLHPSHELVLLLAERGRARRTIILKQLKAPQKVTTVFSDADIRLLLACKPNTAAERRKHALVQTLLDTGCRIDEVVKLAVTNIDMDNLLLAVNGKGNKERRVPFALSFARSCSVRHK